MSEKAKILTALRRSNPPETPAPELDPSHWVRYDDPLAQFRSVVESVGGAVLEARDDAQLTKLLSELPVAQSATVVYSQLPQFPGTLDPATIDDPHDLADVDLCCLPAQFGVAENGAVWTTGPTIESHRAIVFLSQHLVLTIPRSLIVNTMHEAYARIESIERGFGVFIAGPSKTADIEQSLVIGAHGARSLHVVLV